MRIAVAKPEWRIRGGFELVVDRLSTELEALGHDVRHFLVDVPSLPRSPFGRPVDADTWAAAPEYFRYLSMVDAFTDLDIPEADVVLSTQPPSFATRFRRHLSLFFHHHRIYYDLSEVFIAAGFAERDLHLRAQELVREVDGRALAGVDRFLVSSNEIRSRLVEMSHITTERIVDCRVGITRAWSPPPQLPTPEHVLCVSRHEFPKRAELFVEAVCRLPDVVGVMVGSGGRLPRVQWLEHELRRIVDAGAPVEPSLTWLNDGHLAESAAEGDRGETNLRFAQDVSDVELYELYLGAICVVAPAYREDYGLTALEAMRLGVPVVVCEDGGGLAELVGHRTTGLVVEPTGSAIAAAIRELKDDRDLRRELGRNGMDVAAGFTWHRTVKEFSLALEDGGA